MAEQIRVERTIRADASELYDLVSDLPRMGEWSPENTGGKWVNGAKGPVVGAHFKGSNKSGRLRWSTDVVVTAARPGEQFAFDVTFGPFKIASWAYLFEQDGNKTRVTETWTDHRLPVVGTISSLLVGIRDRPGLNRKNMEATLAKLAAAVEV
jgi:ribosome-associated toxin RatA of RatAB toxin-antitoxin module